MARIRDNDQLLASVYDRLIDLDGDSSAPKSRSQILFELKQSVRRDLQNLLNTRWKCVHWPPGYEELELSLVNYGIPDFTGVNMGGYEEQTRLIQIVERAVGFFEPRFQRFSIEQVSSRVDYDRTLRFKIEGLLRAEPSPEPVSYDTQLNVNSAEFEVKQS